MSTVFVTGGAGYIGSHMCKLLTQAGHVPVTLDNLSTGRVEAVQFGPFEQLDLTDPEALTQAFAKYRPEAVLHFAAFSQVGEAMVEPGKYWRNNVLGALNLIEAMIAANCRQLVFSSTCAIYGEQDGVTLDESSAQAPLNAYGASKRAIEDMLRDFASSDGLRSVVFRYFNVAGADPENQIGEAHDPETHLIPVMLQAVSGMRTEMVIHGTDYETPDGTCIRDYVHVMDLVRAHLAGLDWLQAGRESRVFNLGTGQGYSVGEVLAQAEAVIGAPVPTRYGPRRSGDATRLVSGSTRAKSELGWTPEATLDDMIRDAWAWHRRLHGNAT